jgi:hypothetical protein
MSGSEADDARSLSIVLPPTFGWVVEVLGAAAGPGLPAVVLVGGIGVTVRLAATGAPLRATADIDLVSHAKTIRRPLRSLLGIRTQRMSAPDRRGCCFVA